VPRGGVRRHLSESISKVVGPLADAGRITWSASPGWLSTLLVGSVVSGIAPIAVAVLMRALLNGLTSPHHVRVELLLAIAAAMGVVALGLSAFSQYISYANSRLGRASAVLTQGTLFRAVNAAPGLSQFEDPAFYDRLRIAQYVGQFAPAQLLQICLQVVQSGILFVGFLVTIVFFGWPLVFILSAAAVPAAVIEFRLNKLRARTTWQSASLTRRQFFYSMLQSDLQAAKEIRLFGLGSFLLERMQAALRAVNRLNNDLDRRQLRLQVAGMGVQSCVSAGCLIYVVLEAANGRFRVGDVALFAAASFGLQGGLANVMQALVQGQQSLVNFGHYRTIVSGATHYESSAPVDALSGLRQAVRFNQVSFRYDGAKDWALREVDLTFPIGKVVALVGVNGAGKSTVVKLLCRFYEPSEGRILWDSSDLRDVPTEALRRRMSVVFQDFMAYELTVRENIGIGDLDSLHHDELLTRAAQGSGFSQTLDSLPGGLDTLLSRVFLAGEGEGPERGVALSGGQWQRVAIARALLREECDFLILDEPSSGLDAEAEELLFHRLRERRRDRALLLVTQRLGVVRLADEIVVLDGGRVIERGCHDDLMRADGKYAQLFRLQAAGYSSAGSSPAA